MQLPDHANTVEFNRGLYHLNLITGQLLERRNETASEPEERGFLFSGRIGTRSQQSTLLRLRDDASNVHDIRLTGFDILGEVGQVVTVLTTARMGQKDPAHIGAYNHDTQTLSLNSPLVRALAAPTVNRWVVSVMLAMAIVFGVMGDGLASFMMVVAVVPAVLVSMGIKSLVGRTRARRFRHGAKVDEIQAALKSMDTKPYLLQARAQDG